MSHRRGKVARLPQELREVVNRMLADGAEYKQVIAELEKRRDKWPAGITGFNKVNIHEWRHGGYKEWYAEQELRDERRAERQETFDFLRESGKDTGRAAQELAKLRLFDVMMNTDSRALADKASADPNHFVRAVNVLLKVRKS